MKKKSTPLVDAHLQSMQGMQEAGTDDFFYTRLKARMLARQSNERNNQLQKGLNFSLKPVWMLGALLLLLVVNVFILSVQFKTGKSETTNKTNIKNFAASYDQAIYTTY
jgi:hypothetical protein